MAKLVAGIITEIDASINPKYSTYLHLRARGTGTLRITQESHATNSYISAKVNLGISAYLAQSIPVMRQATLVTAMTLHENVEIESLVAHTAVDQFTNPHFSVTNYRLAVDRGWAAVDQLGARLRLEAKQGGQVSLTKLNAEPTHYEIRGAGQLMYAGFEIDFSGVCQMIATGPTTLNFSRFSELSIIASDAEIRQSPRVQVINLSKNIVKVS